MRENEGRTDDSPLYSSSSCCALCGERERICVCMCNREMMMRNKHIKKKEREAVV